MSVTINRDIRLIAIFAIKRWKFRHNTCNRDYLKWTYRPIPNIYTDNSYIGVTSRPFWIRIDEHLNLTRRSGSEANSAINKHLDSCQKCYEGTRRNQFDQFRILRHCTSSYTAKIQEALLIKRYNPKLNIQQFNKGASYTLKIYYWTLSTLNICYLNYKL